MGIFSLANRNVTIRSHDWQVYLTPAHFAGEARCFADTARVAPVEPCEMIAGTRLSFILQEAEVPALRHRVCQIAEFYPLPMWLDGEAIPRQDFLHEPLYTEDWQGLRLGIRHHYRWGQEAINFYGLTLEQSLPDLYCNGNTLSVRVDVVDCPHLKLVLPARKEVVQDAFWAASGTTVRGVLYRYVATLPHHDLSYTQWQEAKALGVGLQAARAILHEFTPATLAVSAKQRADSNDYESGHPMPITERSLLIDLDDQGCSEQQIFWRAFEQAQLDYEPVAPNHSYVGYAWYDSLPCLSQVRFEIEQDGKVTRVEPWYEEQFSTGVDEPALRAGGMNFKVQQVWATPCGYLEERALITNGSKNSQEIRLACDVLFLGDSDRYWDEVEQIPMVLSQSAQLSVEDLATLLEVSYFSPSTDSDANSVYTQGEDFCEVAYERATKALLTEQAALQERMTMVAERHLRWIVPSNQKLEIRLLPRGVDEPLVCVELSEMD